MYVYIYVYAQIYRHLYLYVKAGTGCLAVWGSGCKLYVGGREWCTNGVIGVSSFAGPGFVGAPVKREGLR